MAVELQAGKLLGDGIASGFTALAVELQARSALEKIAVSENNNRTIISLGDIITSALAPG